MSLWNDPPGGFHPVSAPDYLPRARLQEIQLQRLRSVAPPRPGPKENARESLE